MIENRCLDTQDSDAGKIYGMFCKLYSLGFPWMTHSWRFSLIMKALERQGHVRYKWTMTRTAFTTTVVLLCLLWGPRRGSEAISAPRESTDRPAAEDQQHELLFEEDVVPIVRVYCLRCHGLEGRHAELDLRTMPLINKGGQSGSVVVPGSAEKSLLYQVLDPGERQESHEQAMKEIEQQSRQGIPRLGIRPSAKHVEMIGTWINSGAQARYTEAVLLSEQSPSLTDEDQQWWSFQKPVRPPIPTVNNQHRVRSPVDAFLLDKLETQGLSFSNDAGPEVLVRRVFQDLIGIPPTSVQLDAYARDLSPDRYERLIDRLLASPHYGERWGRHWLDAAGYTDVMGHDDLITSTWLSKGIWRFRDYVIRSYNEDKPFDRFLLEQIAGDELVQWRDAETYTPRIMEHLVATGFLRLARDQTFEQVSDHAVHRENTLVEMLTIFGTGVLGLTVQCGQCHSHKYEPISQLDYYRFRALFTPAYNPQNWKHSWGDKFEREIQRENPDSGRFLRVVSGKQYEKIRAANDEIDKKIKAIDEKLETVKQRARAEVRTDKLQQLPESLRADVDAALAAAEDQRDGIQRYLVEKLGPLLEVTDEEVKAQLEKNHSEQVDRFEQVIKDWDSKKERPKMIQALWDVGPPPPQYILTRGDYERPGFQVTPGVFSVLDDAQSPFTVPPAEPGVSTSGYRTALGRWLVQENHPLTSRVYVNRVWQRYFERGIVETTDNFGHSGALPSHPELLDWLATEFVRGDWMLKRIHKLILTSTAYRQMSTRVGSSELADPGEQPFIAQSVDPDNRLLWRMPMRRIDSEVLRDSMLTVSGMLDRTMGGPPVIAFANDDGATLDFKSDSLANPADALRRSVYVVNRRNYSLTTLKVFDQPVMATNCTQREKSAVVLQSLTMLNGKFIQDQAGRFATRVSKMAGDTDDERIRTAFRLALGRQPDPREMAASQDLLHEQVILYREADADNGVSAADQALVELCQMLLNTNEFLYIQ